MALKPAARIAVALLRVEAVLKERMRRTEVIRRAVVPRNPRTTRGRAIPAIGRRDRRNGKSPLCLVELLLSLVARLQALIVLLRGVALSRCRIQLTA